MNGSDNDSWSVSNTEGLVKLEGSADYFWSILYPGNDTMYFPYYTGGRMCIKITPAGRGQDYCYLQITTEPMGIEVEGIDSIVSDIDCGVTEYYNLQGIKVNNPSHGNFYIQRNGQNRAKIIY